MGQAVMGFGVEEVLLEGEEAPAARDALMEGLEVVMKLL